jgi:hypothetical protein
LANTEADVGASLLIDRATSALPTGCVKTRVVGERLETHFPSWTLWRSQAENNAPRLPLDVCSACGQEKSSNAVLRADVFTRPPEEADIGAMSRHVLTGGFIHVRLTSAIDQ